MDGNQHSNATQDSAFRQVLGNALSGQIRTDWTVDEVRALYHAPFMELLYAAQTVHRQHFNPNHIQISTLLSVKTGGCPEDCGYCPQSVRYETGLENEALLNLEQVLENARAARANDATRFCMVAA